MTPLSKGNLQLFNAHIHIATYNDTTMTLCILSIVINWSPQALLDVPHGGDKGLLLENNILRNNMKEV